MSHKHLNPTSEEVGFFFLDEFDRVYIQIIVPRVHIDIMYKYYIISLVQITASKERIMNKTVEYPYEGCYPEQEGGFKVWFLVMMILLFTPLLSLVVQEKILFHWGYIIAIYPLGVVVWWFGYFADYKDMFVCADDKRRYILLSHSKQYFQFALKRAMGWFIFLLRK